MTDVEGIPGVFGGSLPSEIWHDFMTAAVSGTPIRNFALPYVPAPTLQTPPTATTTTTTAPTTTTSPPTTTAPPPTTTATGTTTTP